MINPISNTLYVHLYFPVQGDGKDSWKMAQTIYEFSANDIDGNEVSLEKYKWV